MRATRRRTRVTQNNAAPVNSLPDELLVEVFHLGLNATGPDALEAVRYLLSTSSVCSLWRRVALAVPKLWTTIVPISFAPPKQTLARFAAYLARSKTASLDIHLSFTEALAPSKRLLSLIRPHTGRFRSLRLTIASSLAAELVLPLSWPMGALEKLAVQLRVGELMPGDSLNVELIAEGWYAPLGEIDLEMLVWCPVTHLPTSQLRSIRINCFQLNVTSVTDLLSRSPLVSDVDIEHRISALRVAADNDPHDRFLPHVHSLKIRDVFPLSFHTLFGTPALRSLTIKTSPRIGRWSFEQSVSSVPTWPQLQCVEIIGEALGPIAVADFKSFLSANPTITRLSLVSLPDTITAISGLLSFPSTLVNSIPESLVDLARHLRDQGQTEDLIAPALEHFSVEKFPGNSDFGPTLFFLLMQRPGIHISTDLHSWDNSNLTPTLMSSVEVPGHEFHGRLTIKGLNGLVPSSDSVDSEA